MLQWFILMILIGKANVMDDLRCDHDMGENDDHDMPEDEGGQSIAKSIEIASLEWCMAGIRWCPNGNL